MSGTKGLVNFGFSGNPLDAALPSGTPWKDPYSALQLTALPGEEPGTLVIRVEYRDSI